MTEHLITIDGIKFDVMLIKINRSADILDKYANRTVDGDLKREVLGTYYNYSLEFAYNDKAERYNILWNKLSEPKDFHDITIVDTIDVISFKGYISSVKDEIIYADPNNGSSRRFQGLSCDLIAKLPNRRP